LQCAATEKKKPDFDFILVV